MALGYKYIYLEFAREQRGHGCMRKGFPRLAKTVKTIANSDYGELRHLFEPWVSLPKGFGSPKRERLFSPLTDLLAFSGARRYGRRLVPSGVERLPGLARDRRGKERFA